MLQQAFFFTSKETNFSKIEWKRILVVSLKINPPQEFPAEGFASLFDLNLSVAEQSYGFDFHQHVFG